MSKQNDAVEEIEMPGLLRIKVDPNDPVFRKKLLEEVSNLSCFIITVVLYFSYANNEVDLAMTTTLKCAPIVSLGFFVILKGFKYTKEYHYSQMVLYGLFFSCIGDFLLNLDHFECGMAFFGAAQMFYIAAFGFKPLKSNIGAPLYVLAAGLTMYIFDTLSISLMFGLPIYTFLLTTMCWRAIVRTVVKYNNLSMLGAIGSICFVISDTLISVNMFIHPFTTARGFVMLFYYLAQSCIALSTLSDVAKFKYPKGNKKLSRKFRAKD